jgi:hypothetical protein
VPEAGLVAAGLLEDAAHDIGGMARALRAVEHELGAPGARGHGGGLRLELGELGLMQLGVGGPEEAAGPRVGDEVYGEVFAGKGGTALEQARDGGRKLFWVHGGDSKPEAPSCPP